MKRFQTRRFNFALLSGSLFVLIALAIGTFYLHRYQQFLASGHLLASVDQFLAREDWARAVDYLLRYQAIHPNDAATKVKIAQVYNKIAVTREEVEGALSLQHLALAACESTPELAVEIPDIRQSMMARLMEMGRYEDALEQIAKLAGPKADLDLTRSLALCRFRLASESRSSGLAESSKLRLPRWFSTLLQMNVVDLLLKAYVDNPQNMETSIALASVCLGDSVVLQGSVLAQESRETLINRAVMIADRLIAAHPKDANAWLAHYEITSQRDRNTPDTDLEKAIALAPQDPRVLTQVGINYLNRAKAAAWVNSADRKEAWLLKSEQCLSQVIDSRVVIDSSVFAALGEVLVERGRPEEALEVWRTGSRKTDSLTTDLHLNMVRVLLDLNRLEEAGEALLAMDEAMRRDSNRMSKSMMGIANRLGKQYWASYQLANGDYQSAIATMEAVVSGTKELDSINQAEALAFLGGCYLKIGQWDRAAESFEQAVAVLPDSPEYHRGAASAWFAASRYSEALKQLLLISSKQAFDWVQICEVVLELQRRYTADPALWMTFDKASAEARRMIDSDPKLTASPWTIDLFKADSEILRATADQREAAYTKAIESLLALCGAYPDSLDLKRYAIERFKSWGALAPAQQLVDDIKKTVASDAESVIAQAEILLREGLAEDATRVIQARLEIEPDNERLKQGMVQIRSVTTDWKTAIEDVARNKGNRLVVLRRMYEVALDSPVVALESDLQNPEKLKEQLERWCSRLEKIETLLHESEGEDGTEWRYVRGRRLLAAGTIDVSPDMTEIVDLAGFLDRNRPQWAESHILQGMLSERQGNLARAIRELNRAVRNGAQELVVFEKLTDLMYRQGMISEARIVLDKLGQQSNRSRKLSSLAMELAGGADRDQLEVANSGVLARPKDPMAWLWLAQVTEVHSRNAIESVRIAELDKAEQAFVKANELTNNSDIRIINAQFNFYWVQDRKAEALEVMERVKAAGGIDAAIRFLSLGQMYLTVGEVSSAIEAFQSSIENGADPIEVGNRISQLWLTLGNRERAISQLEQIHEAAPADASTRRRLAALLASRDRASDWIRVEELLSPTRSENTPDDVRLQVLLLSRKGTIADLAKAEYLLELLVEDPTNRTDEDRFQLASLYLRHQALLLRKQGGESNEARQLSEAAGRLLKMATTGSQPAPEYIYTYADFLLKQDRYYDALEESQRLSLIAPDGFPTMLLKARLLVTDAKNDDAKALVMSWLETRLLALVKDSDVAKKATPLVQAGQAMVAIGYPKEAEKLLREAFSWDPRAAKDYVQTLLKTDDETVRQTALEFLVQRAKEDPTNESAMMLADLLKAGDASDSLMASAEEVLTQLEASTQADPQLLRSLADLWIWQGKSRQAIDTFRRIIELRPNDVVAMNNLANLLAEEPEGTEEALKYIDRAIELAGPKPVLLDSKGTILLLGKRHAEAIEILQVAVEQERSDPRIALHLYIALANANRTSEAEAVRASLDVELLKKFPLTRNDQIELEKIISQSKL